MMHHARVAWTHLPGCHVLVFLQVRREHVGPKQVGPARTDDRVLLRFEHQVGLAELPAFGKLLRPGCVPGIALGRAAVHPGRQHGDFRRRQFALADELVTGRRLPRRHQPLFRVMLDVVRPVGRLAIGHQGEGGRLARPMTALAALLQNGQHVAVEGDLAGSQARLLEADGAAECFRPRQTNRFAGQDVFQGQTQVLARDGGFLLQPG